MEKAIIPKKGTFKCVLLSDGVNTVFRAGEGESHKEVAWSAADVDPELEDYSVKGGGRISIGGSYFEENDKLVKVYGYSVDYGKMDKNVVQELLAEYCYENELDFINESGEGY